MYKRQKDFLNSLEKAIQNTSDVNHQTQFYMLLISLHDADLPREFRKAQLENTQAIVNTQAHKFPLCYHHLGNFYAEEKDAQAKSAAVAAYRQALDNDEQSSALPLADLIDDVDEKIKLYAIALNHYTHPCVDAKILQILETLKTLRLTHYLTGKQKASLALLEQSQALVAVNVKKTLDNVATLEKFAGLQSLAADDQAQLATLAQAEDHSAIAIAARQLQKHFAQKTQQCLLKTYSVKENKQGFTNDLSTMIKFMRACFSRFQFGLGSKRRKLYLCIQTILLAMPLDKSQLRYPDISLEDVQLAIHQASAYLLEKSLDTNFKYQAFAKMGLSLVKDQQAKNVLTLNSNALIYQKAKHEKLEADVVYALNDIGLSDHFYGRDLDHAEFFKQLSSEKLLEVADLGPDVDVTTVIVTLKKAVQLKTAPLPTLSASSSSSASMHRQETILPLDLLTPAPNVPTVQPSAAATAAYPVLAETTVDPQIIALQNMQQIATASGDAGDMSFAYLDLGKTAAAAPVSSAARVFDLLTSPATAVSAASVNETTHASLTARPASASKPLEIAIDQNVSDLARITEGSHQTQPDLQTTRTCVNVSASAASTTTLFKPLVVSKRAEKNAQKQSTAQRMILMS